MHLHWYTMELNVPAVLTLIAFLFVVLDEVVGSIECRPKGPCSCEMSDGSGTIDLSPISNVKPPRFKGILETTNPDFKFDYDPCKSFTNGNCQNVFVCQIFKDNQNQYDAGKKFSTTVSSPNEVKFIYTTLPRTTTITLKCDPKGKEDKISEFTEPLATPDHYSATLTSKYACARKIPPKKADTKKKRISTGTLLCILLLVGIVLYLAVGIVINKYARKKEGTQLVPNVEFWTDFPSLVKDGCVFSYGKVRGKRNEYERI